MRKHLPRLFWVALPLLLAACSKQAEVDVTAAAKTKAAASASSAVNPFVHAVKVTVGEAPMDVAFELQSKPLVNQPVTLTVRMTGMFNSTGITAKFSAHEPVKLHEVADWKLDGLQAGQAQDYPITFVASAAGVYTVDVSIESVRDNYTKVFTYAIPVAVADPAATPAASSASAPASK